MYKIVLIAGCRIIVVITELSLQDNFRLIVRRLRCNKTIVSITLAAVLNIATFHLFNSGFVHFSRMILSSKACGVLSTMKFSNYGSYCGIGGEGVPIDKLDQCCCYHDFCYGELDKCRKGKVSINNMYMCHGLRFLSSFVIR